jgi:Trk K+ transport system NAD-binding subunit
MLHDKNEPLRVEDWSITAASPFAHKTVGEVRALNLEQFLVIALSDERDSWRFNPADDTELQPGQRLIFMSSPHDCQRFYEIVGTGH